MIANKNAKAPTITKNEFVKVALAAVAMTKLQPYNPITIASVLKGLADPKGLSLNERMSALSEFEKKIDTMELDITRLALYVKAAEWAFKAGLPDDAKRLLFQNTIAVKQISEKLSNGHPVDEFLNGFSYDPDMAFFEIYNRRIVEIMCEANGKSIEDNASVAADYYANAELKIVSKLLEQMVQLAKKINLKAGKA